MKKQYIKEQRLCYQFMKLTFNHLKINAIIKNIDKRV